MACSSSMLSQASRVPVCGLVALVFHAALMCAAQAQSIQAGNVIRVWSVGSPLTGALPQTVVPRVLQRQAEKLGYTINVLNMRAVEFAPKLQQAMHEHNVPEILTFDNFFVLQGVATNAGRIEGVMFDQEIASSLVMVYETLVPLQPRGWIVLVRSAANYQAAETLAMQQPTCPGFIRATQSPSSAELRLVQQTATDAARAYLACDVASLAAVSDGWKLGDKCFLPEADRRVEAIETCGVTGNRNLAFVSLVGTFKSKSRRPPSNDRDYANWLTNTALGRQSILAVLRNHNGVWRLLAITDDPTNTTAAAFSTVQRLGGLFEDVPAAVAGPDPARLITPEAARLRSRAGVFAEFLWRPSPGSDVIGEVAEFLVQDRSTTRERTRLFFLLGHERSLSSSRLWGLLGRWRVWSISRDGSVSFTEHRSYFN